MDFIDALMSGVSIDEVIDTMVEEKLCPSYMNRVGRQRQIWQSGQVVQGRSCVPDQTGSCQFCGQVDPSLPVRQHHSNQTFNAGFTRQTSRSTGWGHPE
jgi:hypothetical protein